jgi:hypothetical protein
MQTKDGLAAKEYKFGPEAYEYIAKFLREIHR